jgi:hypothetical protein
MFKYDHGMPVRAQSARRSKMDYWKLMGDDDDDTDSGDDKDDDFEEDEAW